MSFTRSLASVVAVAVFSSAQAGTVLYVDDDADLGGDGLSWDTAYRFLQDALADAAASGEITEIRVDPDEAFPDIDPSNNVWKPKAADDS